MSFSAQSRKVASSVLSGKFTPLLRASFRRQLCCATSKDSRHSCVARLTDDENPSRINPADFPDSTLILVLDLKQIAELPFGKVDEKLAHLFRCPLDEPLALLRAGLVRIAVNTGL